MLSFPQIISFGQKYTHHVVDVHDVRSLQQFLRNKTSTLLLKSHTCNFTMEPFGLNIEGHPSYIGTYGWGKKFAFISRVESIVASQ